MEQGTSSADTTWYKLEGKCVHCGDGDFTCEYGPRHFVLCSCCNNWGTHVECFEKHKNQTLTEEFINSGTSWFCGKIAAFFGTQNGVRMPVRGEAAEYTMEVVRYDPDSRGARSVVDAAVKIFRDAFGRMTMPNGKDYIEMCCTAYESPDDEVGSDSDDDESSAVDFTGFRVVALRKGNQVVTVATLRLFGTQLAEMPYVATRQGFRRAGHCRRLLKGVEDMLRKLRVQWLVLPSVKSILTMWRYSFNFMPLTLEELASLEAHIISPDFGTVQLLKKRMWPPLAGQRGGSRGGRGSRAAAAAGSNDGKLAGQQGGSVRGRGSGARGRGAGAAAVGKHGGQLQLKFGGGRRRRSRAAALSKAEGSASDADGETLSSDGEDDAGAGSLQDEESQAAAEERAAAQAAWALFEQEKKQKGQQSSSSSSSDESDDQSSSDEDIDKPEAKRRSRKRKKVGKASGDDGDYKGDASSSSDSSDSDSGLVSEDDGDFQRISKHKVQQQQHKRGAAAAATATVSGSAGTAAAAAAASGSAAESSGLPTQGERDAVLQQLIKEVEKAGGKLEDGWTVRLVGKTPTGNWRTKYFVAPGGAPVFTGILAVKRHLGLAPPLAGPHAAPLAAAAAAGGPSNKRQRITDPYAGGTTAVSGALHCPASVAKRLKELRMGRARRRHMSDATIGVGLADAVKTFYTAAVTEIVNAGSHRETLELQQQVEFLQAQLDCCYSSADSVTAQLSSCRDALAAVKAERAGLQAERSAQESELAERDALVASQHALIDILTQQLGCATTAAVAAVEKPLTAAAEVLTLARETRPAVAAVENLVTVAAESLPVAGEMQDSAVLTKSAAEQQQAVIAQLRQLLETREAEIAGLKQYLEATCGNTPSIVGSPLAAATFAAPLSPPLLASDKAAVLTAGAAGSVQQVLRVGPGHSEEPWGCQEALGSGGGCPDMLDAGSRGYSAVEDLGSGLTCAAEEPIGTAKPSLTASNESLDYARAACQTFSETAKPSPAAGDTPLDCAAAAGAACQPFNTEASQQCGTQTLQFSEDQIADGPCDVLPPAHELACLAAATQQAEQQQKQIGAEAMAPLPPADKHRCLAAITQQVDQQQQQQQQKPGAEAVAPLPPAHELGCLAAATQQLGQQQKQEKQQQQQQHTADIEIMTSLAVLPARLVTEPAAASAAGAVAADGCTALSASIAAEAQTIVADTTAPARNTVDADVLAATAAAAANGPCKQKAAAAAAAAQLSTEAALISSSEPTVVEQPAAVAAAATNRKPRAVTLSAAAAVSGSQINAEAAAAAPLSSSKPPADPTTAAATAPASGGSSLSDSFLSGLLPDVVGCLMRSPAFNQATAQQQQQQQLGSPEVEQPLDRSKGMANPSGLKVSADAVAAAPSQQRLPDCTAHFPAASAAAAQSAEADSPTASAEPDSDEGSYDPADIEPSKSSSPPAYATSPAAAVAAAPVAAHVSDGSSGSSSSRKRPWTGDQHDTIPAALVTPSRLGTKAAGTAAAEDSKQPAEKRQKIHHHRHGSSSRHHKRTSNAVLDLFGDVALLEGLQELHSPGSSSKPGGSSSNRGGGNASGASASGNGGVPGPSSGSSIRIDDHPSSASVSQAPPPAFASEGGVRKLDKAGGASDAMLSDRETTPVQDAFGEIPAGPYDKPQQQQQQQQHTPSSDGCDSGLPDALAEMFEHLAADMARDGMLPGNTARTARAPDTRQTLAANAAAAAGNNSEGSRPQARQVASVLGQLGNTAAAAGTGVGKIAGSVLSAAAGIIDRASGVAVGATVAGVASSGVGFKQGLTKAASIVVDDELVAAGSVPMGTEENFAAALDTAALFAFAGDME